jgi:hypothetical protein
VTVFSFKKLARYLPERCKQIAFVCPTPKFKKIEKVSGKRWQFVQVIHA